MRAREARERQRASVGPQHRLGNAFTASSRFLLLRSLEQLLERKFRGEPVKRHRGEPGHTHGTHGRTRAQGSHRRTSQPHPNPPTHPQPHDHDRIRGRLNSRRPRGGEWRGGGGTCAYWVAGKKTPWGAGTHRGTHGRTSRGGTRSRIATQTERQRPRSRLAGYRAVLLRQYPCTHCDRSILSTFVATPAHTTPPSQTPLQGSL